MLNISRKKISITLNFLTAVSAFLGVILSCVYSVEDGYFPWVTRLFYFTQQSNVWIGTICLIFGILSVIGLAKGKNYLNQGLCVVKLVFTACITITCLVFCCLLAPFADFNVWTFSSILTHVVTPVLAILDYFLCEEQKVKKGKHCLFVLIPLTYYFLFALIMSAFEVDFGRGDTFPYFFMNYHSEVGLFGFIPGVIPQFGCVYWLILICGMGLGICYLYYRLHKNTREIRKLNKK